MFGKKTRKPMVLLVAAAIFLLVAMNVYFIMSYSSGEIVADHWRHFDEILIPVEEGEASFWVFWANHHPNPILHWYEILISGPIFNYDLKYDALFSLSLHALIFFLLWRTVSNVSGNIHPLLFGLGVVFSGFYWFSLITPHTFLWTLISLQSLGYIFGILIFVSLLIFSQSEVLNLKGTLIVAALCCLSVLLNFDYGVLFFGSTLGAMWLHIFWNRDWKLAQNAILLMIFVGFFAFIIRTFLIPESEGSNLNVVESLKSFPQYFIGLFTAIASGVIGENIYRPNFIADKDGREILKILIMCFVCLIYFLAAMLALKMKRKSLPFLALLIFPALFSLAVFISREPANFDVYLSVPRYATNFKLGWLAAILIFLLNWQIFSKNKLSKCAFFAVVFIGILLWSAGTRETFTIARYWEASSERNEVLIYMTATESDSKIKLGPNIVGSNANYQNTLDYLQKNKLSVFSDQYDSGELLKIQKSLKSSLAQDKRTEFDYRLNASRSADRYSQRCVKTQSIPNQAFRLKLENVDNKNVSVSVPTGSSIDRFSVLPGTNIFYGFANSNIIKICVFGAGSIQLEDEL